MVARPETGSIPDAPGSYQFLDGEGRVIYVGKAKSLRNRLSNYFAPPATLPERTYQMVQAADHVEWIVAKNEVEAFFLEFNLIKRHKPRFNIRLKDDKSYPYLAVTLDEEWPRAMVMRGQHRKGVRYFGPYAHAYAIRETLDLLLRTFPIRTCTKNKFDRHARLGRPCLYAHIEKCVAPCVGDIDHDDYDKLVHDLLDFLDGEHDAVIHRLEERMRNASDQLEFELAARVRDQLASVHKAIERQQMVGTREEDYDLIGLAEDPLEASVQLFFVRKGRVVGRKGLIVDKVEEVETPALVARVVEQLYADAPKDDIPKEILVPVEPEDLDLYEEFLALNRGTKVRIRIPQRGGKRELLETAMLNARESFARHKLRRASDHNARPHAARAAARARPARGTAAHRVLRHLEPAGHRDRRVDGRDGRRSAEALRLPALQDPAHPHARRLRVDGGGADAPLPSLPPRSRRRRAQRQALRLPTEPGADRRRQGPTRRGGARARGARPRRHLRREPREEVRGGVPTGEVGADPHRSRLRGALSAPAGARRGAPLRHHLPPRAAGQVDDQVGARRRARPRDPAASSGC